MSASGKFGNFYFLFYVLITWSTVYCWDNDDLELFDLVEEVNENFYELLGVTTSATSSEIKKAYRKKTLILHPDKNEAADAEEQFRKLVAVYEILKDDDKREKYNLVLENGLPDWRQPVYYYRKARKLGLAELALILCIVVTIGHYFVMWAVYLERRLALEDFFESKRKRETKGKRSKAALQNERLEEDMHSTLQAIPKPQLTKLWPVTLSKWIFESSVSLPARLRERKEAQRLEMEYLRAEQEERERQEAAYKEDLELRKQKRKMKSEPETAPLCDNMAAPVVYGGINYTDSDQEEKDFKQTAKDGCWTDEDFVLLSKAYIRFPGGTSKRWEKIAEMVGRPVNEVTLKCKQMKGNLQMNLDSSIQGGTKNTANNKVAISDEIISQQDAEIIGTENDDNKVRRRNKQKPQKDTERTLIIPKSIPKTETQNKSQSLSGAGDSSHKNVNHSQQNGNQSKNEKLKKSETKGESQATLVKANQINEGDTTNKSTNNSKAVTKKTETPIADGAQATEVDTWSQNQQVTFEWALKHTPKGTDQRWEKIAEHVPGKTKEECIARFKCLAEIVKQRKQQQV